MLTLDNWRRTVKEVSGFLDESYDVPLYGLGLNNFTRQQLPWGRIGIEKFMDRVIPIISGGLGASSVESIIVTWIRQAVEFGNSTLIVLDDGRVRVANPAASFAQKTWFGDELFIEERSDGTQMVAENSLVFLKTEREIFFLEDTQVFNLFYKDDNLHPAGQSRITPALRGSITQGSRLRGMLDALAYSQSHKQLVFTNMDSETIQAYRDRDTEALTEISELVIGVNKALALGRNADNNERIGVESIDPTDPSGLIKVYERVLMDTASGFNIEPREYGLVQAVAPSEQAIYAQKEDLTLEVKAFTKAIHSTVFAALAAIAEIWDEPEPSLKWGNPSTPSQASQLDAFVKLVSAIPAARYSRVALIEFGISPELVDDLLAEDLSVELEKALEEAYDAQE